MFGKWSCRRHRPKRMDRDASWQARHDATSLAVSNGEGRCGCYWTNRWPNERCNHCQHSCLCCPVIGDNRLGTYVVKTFKDESFRAYVPPPLPPDPPLALQPLLPLLEQANQALGRLDGLASILPDPSLFIYLYVRKEAVLSSQIEGTQSSFSDLMLFESAEAPSVPLEDVQEVSNYVAAMNHGLRRLRGVFPLPRSWIREINKIPWPKEPGSKNRPGESVKTKTR